MNQIQCPVSGCNARFRDKKKLSRHVTRAGKKDPRHAEQAGSKKRVICPTCKNDFSPQGWGRHRRGTYGCVPPIALSCNKDISISPLRSLPNDLDPRLQTELQSNNRIVTSLFQNTSRLPVDRWQASFEGLELRSKRFVEILVFLGSNEIPLHTLERACKARRFWTKQGEIKDLPIVGVDSIFHDFELLQSTVLQLLESGLLVSHPERRYSVIDSLQQYVHKYTMAAAGHELQAVIIAFHAFPQDKIIEPFL